MQAKKQQQIMGHSKMSAHIPSFEQLVISYAQDMIFEWALWCRKAPRFLVMVSMLWVLGNKAMSTCIIGIIFILSFNVFSSKME